MAPLHEQPQLEQRVDRRLLEPHRHFRLALNRRPEVSPGLSYCAGFLVSNQIEAYKVGFARSYADREPRSERLALNPLRVVTKLHNLQAPFGSELHGKRIRIATDVADLFDAGVHDHLYAEQAWLMGAVEDRVAHRDAVVGSLDDGILLGMQRALTTLSPVYNANKASYVLAMGHPRRATVVAGSKNPLVADHDCPDSQTRTGRAGRDLVGDAHEVLIPRRTGLLQCGVLPGGVYRGVFKAFHTACPPRRPSPVR